MKAAVIFVVIIIIGLGGFTETRSSGNNEKINYDGYSVFKVILRNGSQREAIEKFLRIRNDFNVWKRSDQEYHIMVNPAKFIYFKNYMSRLGIDSDIWISNVQNLIDEEEVEEGLLNNDINFGWTRYYPLDTIYAWMDEILANYPEVTEGFNVGQSYEGRDIRGIKISYKSGNPGIFIESNIHAREWITSATATWFINKLLTSVEPEIKQLAENIDWYIVPVLNVDGFTYTHEKDRLWRKTRQPVSTSPCIGTDPNRNFDSYWMANNGASDNPCAETYAGPYPFSEPEIKALTDYISGIKDKLNILLAFHSYSQLLLSPYGHTAESTPENYDDLMSIAKAYSDAVANLPYQTDYEYGTAAQTLYTASGSTIDWAYNEENIKITYTIEFRDKGRYGFILPPVHIIPNCEETLAGILKLVEKATELGYLEVKY